MYFSQFMHLYFLNYRGINMPYGYLRRGKLNNEKGLFYYFLLDALSCHGSF
jgi:hypothetical protein